MTITNKCNTRIKCKKQCRVTAGCYTINYPQFGKNSCLTSNLHFQGKSTDKTKKICDDMMLIENELNKELKVYLHDPTDDLANLIIQNNIDFTLNTRGNTQIPILSNRSTKLKIASVYTDTQDALLSETKENDSENEIIEIKCIQKLHETNDRAPLVCTNDIISENTHKTQSDKIFNNELKSDLQSLLIMMAVSNSYNDKGGNKSYIHVQNNQEIDQESCNRNKKENVSIETSEKLIPSNGISDVLKIQPIQLATSNERFLKKYVKKWVDYVKKRRENKNKIKRSENINKFFERLEKKKASLNHTTAPANKAKLQARDFSTYQHRYKVQKHIIALQKAKLEQQNRLIEELKYNKILDASRQSLDFVKEDVRQTYYEIDKHLKPKLKCLTNELKIQDIEDKSLVLHCLKVPQFLQRMEARAREREEKHAMIRERRKQIEEERIRLKQEAELAKAEMDKEEKMKRIIDLREKRRREKIENIRKKQHAERIKALIVMADLHYEKYLTCKYGIRPFKLLIKIKHDNMETAKVHYQFQMKKNIFLHWMWYTEDMWHERNFKADKFYKTKLLQKTFNSFKKSHNEYLIKMQVAKDYYDLYLTQLVFKKFQEGILILKKEFDVKWNNAVIYYNSNLLFKTLTCWRTLPALNALKREQDARKLRWREKVLQVVPDYVPPED